MPRSILALAATLLVAGCAVLSPRTKDSAVSQPTHFGGPPLPARGGVSTPAALSPAAVPVPPPKPPSPDAPPTVETMALVIGRDLGGVVDVLGEPGLVLQEPPAMVWRYEIGGCRLDVFFYVDMETRQRRALSYKVASSDGLPEIAERCRKLAQASDEQRIGRP